MKAPVSRSVSENDVHFLIKRILDICLTPRGGEVVQAVITLPVDIT